MWNVVLFDSSLSCRVSLPALDLSQESIVGKESLAHNEESHGNCRLGGGSSSQGSTWDVNKGKSIRCLRYGKGTLQKSTWKARSCDWFDSGCMVKPWVIVSGVVTNLLSALTCVKVDVQNVLAHVLHFFPSNILRCVRALARSINVI